jgi:hypothetical protein
VQHRTRPNSAPANRRPAGQSDGSDNLSAIVAADRAFPAAVAELGRFAENCDILHEMKILTRSNRIYDTTRFGQPEIRIRHRPGTGKKSPQYVLRCGCCSENLRIFYAEDGLEIGGVNGAIEDWREILLPLLLIEKRGSRFVDVSRKPTGRSANKTVQATAGERRGSNRAHRASRA